MSAAAEAFARAALLALRAPSWDVLPPDFGDRLEALASAYEAELGRPCSCGHDREAHRRGPCCKMVPGGVCDCSGFV